LKVGSPITAVWKNKEELSSNLLDRIARKVADAKDPVLSVPVKIPQSSPMNRQQRSGSDEILKP
jgi:hypothetical protein